MHILIDLITREGAFLAVMLALGAAPASLLSADRFDGAARLALAPILGFCAGTCVATTVLWFVPAGDSYWMLFPLAVASLAFAARRTLCAGRQRLSGRDALQLALVCLAVAGPLTGALVHRGTVGPAAYFYTDVNGYVAEQDGAMRTSIHGATEAFDRSVQTGRAFSDLTLWNWSFISWFDQNLDAAPLGANVTALLGVGATGTQSPFLIVLLLAGALAAFAAVRYATGSRTWAAVLAGAMFGGPFFLELWFDSFQAAIVAIGLVMPLALALGETVRTGRWADLALLALVLATVAIVYPLFLPVMVVMGGLVLAWLAVGARRRGARLGAAVRPVALRLAALAALVAVLDPVGIARDVSYYQKVARNEVPLPRVGWHLPLDVIPGWLLQTRGFWAMPPLAEAGFKQLILGALIPLALLPFIVLGLRRHRPALALVALGAVFSAVAVYSYASHDACTYCAERVLLPLAPIAAVLLALGLHAAATTPSRWAKAAAIAAAALVVVSVGQRARIELVRFVNGSYFLDDANREVLARLPSGARAVHVEGYGQTFAAQAEQALTYHLVNERVPGRASLSFGSDLRNSIQYLTFGGARAPGAEFKPGYDYVLTRFAGIDSGRRVVARSGPIALERRARALDVIPYQGLVAPLGRLDRTGTAWVQPELGLKLHVVGPTAGRVWARLTFRADVGVTVASAPGLRAAQRGRALIVCAPATGTAPIRDAQVQLAAPLVPGPIPPGLFPPQVPARGLALTAMRAVTGSCAT